MEKLELIGVYKSTIQDLERGFYRTLDFDTVRFRGVKAMIRDTELYEELRKNDGGGSSRKQFENTKIYVQNIDTFDKAKEMGPDAAVLNMASASNRGGGVMHGSRAQEESLCRRSNLILSLRSVDYPLPVFGGVYSPRVIVYKDHDYQEMDKYFKTNVISVAAVVNPMLTEDKTHVERRFVRIILEKIRTILRIAKLHNHTKLVLGAFGCGAYHNPASHIAELFKLVLGEPEFSKSFEEICFAIIEDNNSKRLDNPEGNLIPFARVFGMKED